MVSYTIGGKPIHVVQKHQEVLVAWADIRRGLDSAPLLFTLDHHTDTHKAFLCHAVNVLDDDEPQELERVVHELVADVDFMRPETVLRAVEKLRHDEHIDAAIRCGLISTAFVLSHQYGGTPSREEIECRGNWRVVKTGNSKAKVTSSGDEVEHYEIWRLIQTGNRKLPKRPFTYDIPRNKVFEVSCGCHVGCDKSQHDDECDRLLCDQAIESSYLSDRMAIIDEMLKSIGLAALLESDFILDIDLDYFRTADSVEPKDTSAFYNLIRRAVGVTIATEPSFVEICKLPGADITADSLLAKMQHHLAKALGQ